MPPARPQHDSHEATEEAALQQWEMLASEEEERSSSAEEGANEADAPEASEDAVEAARDASAGVPAASERAPDDAPSGSFSSPGAAISSRCTTLHGCLPYAAEGSQYPANIAVTLSTLCSGDQSAVQQWVLVLLSVQACLYAGDFYTDELAMESGQSPAETDADQELESKALPGEETASTFEHKEQSKLAQVCTLSDTRLPELHHNYPPQSSCITLSLGNRSDPFRVHVSEA